MDHKTRERYPVHPQLLMLGSENFARKKYKYSRRYLEFRFLSNGNQTQTFEEKSFFLPQKTGQKNHYYCYFNVQLCRPNKRSQRRQSRLWLWLWPDVVRRSMYVPMIRSQINAARTMACVWEKEEKKKAGRMLQKKHT